MRRNPIERNRIRHQMLRTIKKIPHYVNNKLQNIDPFLFLFKSAARAKYLGDLLMMLAIGVGMPLMGFALIVFDVCGVRRPTFPEFEQALQKVKDTLNNKPVEAIDLAAVAALITMLMSLPFYFIFFCNVIFINRQTGLSIPRILLFGDIAALIKEHPELVKNNGVVQIPKFLWQPPRDYSVQYLASLALRPRMLSLFVPPNEHKNLFHTIDALDLPLEINYQILSYLPVDHIPRPKSTFKSFEGLRFSDNPHNYSENQAIDDFIECKFKKTPQHNILTVLYALHLSAKKSANSDPEGGPTISNASMRALKNA